MAASTPPPPRQASARPQLFQAFLTPQAPPLVNARAAQRFLAALSATTDRLGALWELVSDQKAGLKRLSEVLDLALAGSNETPSSTQHSLPMPASVTGAEPLISCHCPVAYSTVPIKRVHAASSALASGPVGVPHGNYDYSGAAPTAQL